MRGWRLSTPRASGRGPRLNEEKKEKKEQLVEKIFPEAIEPVSLAALTAALKSGPWEKRKEALAKLIVAQAEEELAELLPSDDPRTGQLAAAGLWECWLNEEGPEARLVIDWGIDLMEEGDLVAAERIFRDLSLEFQGWAEPANKRASILYEWGRYEQSSDLCQWVVDIKPHHFAAWHGLALCAVKLKDWELALRAAQESLRLQPRYNEAREIIRLANNRLWLV